MMAWSYGPGARRRRPGRRGFFRRWLDCRRAVAGLSYRGIPEAEMVGLPSPGGWVAPPARKPGWNWMPPSGGTPRPDLAPRWVRWWAFVPFIDRYALAWMWWHGAFYVEPPVLSEPPPADPGGVREPRRPITPAGSGAITLPADEPAARYVDLTRSSWRGQPALAWPLARIRGRR